MDHTHIEENIMLFWDTNNIYHKARDKARTREKVIIYDGPPFPTGPPHHGHMMTSVVKDTITRYLAATGHYVPRLLGWDMHGTNVDSHSEEYIQQWLEILKKIGRWKDSDSYRTSAPDYTESVWWIYKTLSTKGHIKIEPGISLHCHTCNRFFSDFERYHAFDTIEESTIYYKVKLSDPGGIGGIGSDVYLLVWEMCPWTLYATEAYVINSNNIYVLVDGLVRARMASDMGTVIDTGILLSMLAEDPITGRLLPIINSPLVDANKGTGIMQAAPSMDEKSYDIMRQYQRTEMLNEHTTKATAAILDKLKRLGQYSETKIINRQVSVCSKCQCRRGTILIYFSISKRY